MAGTIAAALAVALAGCDNRVDATLRDGPAAQVLASPKPPAAPEGAPETVLDVAGLVQQVNPAVVSIAASQRVHGPFGVRVRRAVGSGFVLSADGLVLTNSHVVRGNADVRVRLADLREFEAVLIGDDPKLDVALLRLRGASDLSTVELGSSESLRVGDYVVAIGNPFGLGHTVTLGIVSAKERALGVGPYDDLIQTDASINPGSSGGPLFDARGRVVGINTLVRARAQGIGFAIPIDDVRGVLAELQRTGHVRRGALGIAFQEVSYDLSRALALPAPVGALVTDVEEGGPAARVGMRPGDVILAMDGQGITRAQELARLMGRRKPGERVHLMLWRGGSEKSVRVVLSRSGDDEQDRPTRPPPQGPTVGGPLGAMVSDAEGGGARIEAIDVRGPAASELEVGDVVLEANGRRVVRGADLMHEATRTGRGAMLLLRLRRDGDAVYVAIPVR